MIELITGLPGNGKTLYTISQVKAQAERESRQVFYHGIPELNIAAWDKLEDPTKWAEVPPNSIVVLDEAQKTFRNRSLGAAPPKHVTDLETHRHLGIDIVMITQHPSLIDPSVRRLAGRHRHLIRLYGLEASTVHKWDSVKDNCDKNRADSDKQKWKFDKSIYSLYKSAEVHTVKRSIPGRVKMLIGLSLVFVLLIAYMVFFVKKKTQAPEAPVAAVINGAVPGVTYQGGGPGGVAKVDPVQDAEQYMFNQTPRLSGLPHTAPKYDPITTPVRAPVPAMCVQIGTASSGKVSCKCYTQQTTPMEVEFNMCVQIARNGYFQDFDADKDQQQKQQQQHEQKAAQSVAVLSSRPDVSLRNDYVQSPLLASVDLPPSGGLGIRPEPNLNDGPPPDRPSRTVIAQ